MTVSLRHTHSGMLKSAPVGFSWTTFFFGPFPALFRGDLKWFIIMLIVGVFTIWIANFIIFGAIYNKRYLVDLMSKGFTPADEHSRNVLAQKGIVITGGPLPANQSVPQPTPVVTPAPPAAPTPVATPRRANLESQILETARSQGGIVTPADVAIETACNLDKAKQELDDLVNRGHVEMRVRRNGTLVYAFPSLLGAEQREDLEP